MKNTFSREEQTPDFGERIGNIGTLVLLYPKVRALEEVFETAFKPRGLKNTAKKILRLWWNENLSNPSKLTREVFNILYRHKYCQTYGLPEKEQGTIKIARKLPWLDYC